MACASLLAIACGRLLLDDDRIADRSHVAIAGGRLLLRFLRSLVAVACSRFRGDLWTLDGIGMGRGEEARSPRERKERSF